MPRHNNRPPHQPYRFVNTCDTKRRFASEKLARAAAEYQMLTKPTLDLSVYHCNLCDGWHLTRQDPNRR